MAKAEIRVYRSHIEIYPYEMGDSPRIESMLSKYDPVIHQRIVIGFYIEDEILYIPRGMNLSLLQTEFNSIPLMMTQSSYSKRMSHKLKMKESPRDRIQEEAIGFLNCEGKFSHNVVQSQFGLNLDTGGGKTYSTIHAIADINKKAIIIVHKSRLKEQWKKEFRTMTDIDEDKIIDITGSEVMESVLKKEIIGDVYLINHQTIESFARTYSWNDVSMFFNKIGIGIKVVDEAHKFFQNSLMIDFFSNVEKNFYLTATFTRGDPKEVAIYKRAYSNMVRYGEETIDYEENRKHTKLIVIYYRSKPPLGTSVCTGYGFSNYKFTDYAIRDENHTLVKVLRRIIRQTENIEGRVLVTSSKIDSLKYFKDIIEQETDRSVGCVYSKQDPKINEEELKKDIISTTIKSIGEGDNIKGLRVLINLDPIGSKGLADQLRGRLREYSKTEDTFLFYPVDTAFRETVEMFKRILPAMKRKCKEIIFVSWNDL